MKEIPVIDNVELATKLVWGAMQMKPAYVAAGLCIARVFCRERGIDPTLIERTVIQTCAVRGGPGTYEQAVAAARAAVEAQS